MIQEEVTSVDFHSERLRLSWHSLSRLWLDVIMGTRVKQRNEPLPLWPHVIFVDWYGVLSRRRFWDTAHKQDSFIFDFIPSNVRRLFSGEIAESWMLGKIDTTDVIRNYVAPNATEEIQCRLREHLLGELTRARMSRVLVHALSNARSESFVVLATDNMDCFQEAASQRNDIWKTFDDCLISSEIGGLKRTPRHFFGSWLERRRLTFHDATLIDDDVTNCESFRLAGGHAIFFDDSDACWSEIFALTGGRDDSLRPHQ